MRTTTDRRAPAAVVTALVAALLLSGCSAGADPALPAADSTRQPPSLEGRPSVDGLMARATASEVVLTLPDGSARSFLVRPQDAPVIGLPHMASQIGLTDVGFRLFFETEDGVDYVLGGYEVEPPASSGPPAP